MTKEITHKIHMYFLTLHSMKKTHMIKIENTQLEDKDLIKIMIILRKISKEKNLMKEIEL